MISTNKMWCAADNHMCVLYIRTKGFPDGNFMKQLLTKYQIFIKSPKFSQHIHKNHNFESTTGRDRLSASTLSISWQGHVRNLLFRFLPVVSL